MLFSHSKIFSFGLTLLIFNFSVNIFLYQETQRAVAQIIPDETLGNENTRLESITLQRELITNGAQRGENLFHSFEKFDIPLGHEAYFHIPDGVENILGRITGDDVSDIFGTLGVDGSANLFLINPNGFIFGSESSLDIRGSFTVSSGDRFTFADGSVFDAVEANSPSLLTVEVLPGLQLSDGRSPITSSGQLFVGQNLTLSASELNLEGQLIAGSDLLLRSDYIKIRDNKTVPFLAESGGNFIIEGNEIDISVLTHSHSGTVFSGGDIILRSNNPVLTNAIFIAGNDLRIEQMDGRFGDLISDNGHQFQAGENFSTGNYVGTSLKIQTGGNVNIPGEISISSVNTLSVDGSISLSIQAGGSVMIPGKISIGSANDLSINSPIELSDEVLETLQRASIPSNSSDSGPIKLSDGTFLDSAPIVDIRVGVRRLFNLTEFSNIPIESNITIGSIISPGGTVYLTNQFRPNPDVTGSIFVDSLNTTDLKSGGDVYIDSIEDIRFQNINTSGGDFDAFLEGNISELRGNGGIIRLLANGDIFMPNQSFLRSYGLRGGSITLDSNSSIIQEGGPLGSSFQNRSFIESISVGSGRGRNVTLSAPSIFIGGSVFSDTYGSGDGGNLIIESELLETSQSNINTDTFGSGDAGTVIIHANKLSMGDFSSVGSFSFSDSGGNSGDVRVRSSSLTVTDGSQISSGVTDLLSTGSVNADAGDIFITAQDIQLTGFLPGEFSNGNFVGSGIASSVTASAESGNSGNISIVTDTLNISDGAKISTSSFSNGSAGTIDIEANDGIHLDGAVFAEFLEVATRSQFSGIQSELFIGAEGKAGEITINTPILELRNGGSISTVSNGTGPAGSIDITTTDSVIIDGVVLFPQPNADDRFSRIAVLTESQANGDAGTLTIRSPIIQLSNGGQLTAESRGVSANNSGGNILLRDVDLLLLNGNSRISSTSGVSGAGGDGGNIDIESSFLVAGSMSNSDITANAFDGKGGEVTITADGIFGLRSLSRAELASLLNTNDSEQIDPVNVSSSDITAISQSSPNLEGIVTIQTPDTEPTQGVIELPSNLVDATQLISQNCVSGRLRSPALGRFFVLGRRGLPESPSHSISSDRAWEDISPSAHTEENQPITEAQTWTINDRGQVVLQSEPEIEAVQLTCRS